MSDILEFLRARLDEDDRAVLVVRESERTWEFEPGAPRYMEAVTLGDEPGYVACGPYEGPIDDEYGLHIARHDPARVLAEIDAKRRIMDVIEDQVDTPYGEPESFLPPDWLLVLKLLALPYADHPDYRVEWRP